MELRRMKWESELKYQECIKNESRMNNHQSIIPQSVGQSVVNLLVVLFNRCRHFLPCFRPKHIFIHFGRIMVHAYGHVRRKSQRHDGWHGFSSSSSSTGVKYRSCEAKSDPITKNNIFSTAIQQAVQEIYVSDRREKTIACTYTNTNAYTNRLAPIEHWLCSSLLFFLS